jgi:hypothetical protein
MISENLSDGDLERIFPRADKITTKHIEQLWPARIQRATITVVEGDPGAAKSTLSADIAARLTAGREMPGSALASEAAGVVWLGAEDTSEITRENLRVAGAVLERVAIYDKCQFELSLPAAVPVIEREVMRTAAGLLVIDPVSAFIAGSLNSESAVRKALGPLAAMAERTNVAVVLIRHLAKSRGRSAMYTGAGSIGIVAAARSAILVGVEPGDFGRRVAAQIKSNAGPRSASLAFKVVDEAGGKRVEWLGSSDFTAEDLVNPSPNDLNALEEAALMLHSILSEGPVWADEAKSIASKSGITPSTLGRAKRLLRVRSRRKGFGKGSRLYWVLPPASEIARRLKERDMDELMNALVSGEPGPPEDTSDDSPRRRRPPDWGDDDDSADSWKAPT